MKAGISDENADEADSDKALADIDELRDELIERMEILTAFTDRFQVYELSLIHILRIMYCYPEEIYDELIQVMKEEPKICHYLDIPIQHASDSILKRMNRKTNRAELTERIAKLREEIPDIALRTSLIAGFPGETEEDHEELMEFIDEIEFTRLGVFTYSAEEGTKAAEMDGQVQEEVKEERRDRLMELQQEISSDLSQSCLLYTAYMFS